MVHNGLQAYKRFVTMPILRKFKTEVSTFLFMYMNSRDVIICYLELRKTRSVFPIPLEFEISKFACIFNPVRFKMEYIWQHERMCFAGIYILRNSYAIEYLCQNGSLTVTEMSCTSVNWLVICQSSVYVYYMPIGRLLIIEIMSSDTQLPKHLHIL